MDPAIPEDRWKLLVVRHGPAAHLIRTMRTVGEKLLFPGARHLRAAKATAQMEIAAIAAATTNIQEIDTAAFTPYSSLLTPHLLLLTAVHSHPSVSRA